MGKTMKNYPKAHDVSFGGQTRVPMKRQQNAMFKEINSIHRQLTADNPLTANFNVQKREATKVATPSVDTSMFHTIGGNATIIKKGGLSQRQRKRNGGK